MSKPNLIGMRPTGDYVLIYIYDDGADSVDLGNGKALITGIRDTEFDSPHNAVDGKHPGIRSRWAAIVATNSNTPDAFQPGDKVYCEQMQWSRGVLAGSGGQRVWRIPHEHILAIDKDGFTEEEQAKVDAWLNGVNGS